MRVGAPALLTQHFFMLMTHSSTPHPRACFHSATPSAEPVSAGTQVTVTLPSSEGSTLSAEMIWTTVLLGGLCVLHIALLLLAEGSSSSSSNSSSGGPWGRTVTFRRDKQAPRLQRDTSSSTDSSNPSRDPNFASCRLPLTPTEHKILDDNTQEVRA